MVAIPSPPVLGYSFTGLTVSNPNALLPGNFLDQEYNRAFNCLDDIIAVLHVSLNADGTLNGTAANAILTAAVVTANALNPTGAVALETARALSAEGLNATAITTEATARTTAAALLAPKASPTFTGPATVDQIAGIVGTTTNNNAQAGSVGEYVSSTVLVAGAVGLTNGVPANITSISLSPGDWDVQGAVVTNSAGTTVLTFAAAAISSVSATLDVPPKGGYAQQITGSVAGSNASVPTGVARVSLNALTTIYLLANVGFSAGILSAYGFLGARRAR